MGSDDEANRTNILLHKNIILYPSRYQKQHPSAQPSPNDHTDPLIISWVSSEGLGAGVGLVWMIAAAAVREADEATEGSGLTVKAGATEAIEGGRPMVAAEVIGAIEGAGLASAAAAVGEIEGDRAMAATEQLMVASQRQ